MQLPDEYTIQKFHQLAGYPKQKQGGRVHEAGCPLCREGGSWGKKRRLYFIVKENHIFCHNCGWTGNPIKFIQDAQGLTYKEIMDEACRLEKDYHKIQQLDKAEMHYLRQQVYSLNLDKD